MKMRIMNIEDFTKRVVQEIKDFLPKEYEDATIESLQVAKNNNQILTGLMIRMEGINVSPTIYMEYFYRQFQHGKDFYDLLREISEVCQKNSWSESFDIKTVLEFENVKDKLFPRLVNKRWNKKRLAEIPHATVADLAVTYHILLKKEDGICSIPVTNQILEQWGATQEEVHELALRNMPKLLPGVLKPMSSFIKPMLTNMGMEDCYPETEDDGMYVVTNTDGVDGAAWLLDKEFMTKVVEKIGEDFYILPSSIHEAIILKGTDLMSIEQINQMIADVNKNEVKWEDRLSNHAYRYTLKEGLHVA